MLTKENPAVEDVTETEPEVTEEEIARRAYDISQSDESGTDEENWLRAERELLSHLREEE
jgi:hypothetical protein